MTGIKIANAPCSWGVLEFGGEKAPFTRVLDEMRESGYAGTELGDWGFMPTEPEALRAELSKRGLSMLGAFVPVFMADAKTHDEGKRTAVKIAKLLAAVGDKPFIVLADDNGKVPERTKNMGRVTPEMGLKAEQWRTFAAGANGIAKAVRDETGLRTVFHHHGAGYVETPREIDTLMQETDPKLLGLCLDMGHYTFGGGDPLNALRSYADRIWHVHFKDCDPAVARQSRERGWDYFKSVESGVFCELGKGQVHFQEIVAELQQRGYDGWAVVEQDVLPGMGSPLESARRNRAFIKSLGL